MHLKKMDVILVSILAGVVLLLLPLHLYKMITKNADFFERRQIPYSKPELLFGSSREFFFRQIELIDFVKRLYDEMPTER